MNVKELEEKLVKMQIPDHEYSLQSGYFALSPDLIIDKEYTFDQFRKTKYFTDQDPIRVFWLENPFLLRNYNFLVSFFFRDNKIYMLSLVCVDREYDMAQEEERKKYHDKILEEWEVETEYKYPWGMIESNYDKRSNISSIDIVFD